MGKWNGAFKCFCRWTLSCTGISIPVRWAVAILRWVFLAKWDSNDGRIRRCLAGVMRLHVTALVEYSLEVTYDFLFDGTVLHTDDICSWVPGP